MGANTRHFKALMRKNCINWKRTPCGSITEIFCPILLLMILVYARFNVDPEWVDNYSLYSLRHPLYPVARPNSSGQFSIDLDDQPRMMAEMTDFMQYADYVNLNFTIKVPFSNVTKFLTFDDEIEEYFDELEDDIIEFREEYTNLKGFIETTPIVNFTDYIDWDGLKDLVESLGLEEQINIDAIEDFLEEVEERIENPEQTIQEFFNINVTETLDDIIAFETIEDLDLEIPIRLYIPILDITGPFLFYPSHCYGNKKRNRFDSPIIAYIETGTDVEKAVIE